MSNDSGQQTGRAGGPKHWLRELDRILRGDATRLAALRAGTIEVSAGGLAVVLVVLGMIYGICMGCFALFKPGGAEFLQLVASLIKVPALFFLTLLVTLPSLYVFNALVGSRLSVVSMIRLLIAALAVTIAVLASFGPIVAFFSLSTTSYPFMVLLNVLIFAIAGVLGLAFLLQTLQRLTLARTVEPETPAPVEISRASEPEGGEPGQPLPANLPDLSELDAEPPGALERVSDQMLAAHVTVIFRVWLVVYSLVGAQMSWVLRPFIGDPSRPFTWFRPRESNFFQAVSNALWSLFS